MEPLGIDLEAREDAVVVRVRGDVDSSTVDQLVGNLIDALDMAGAQPARLLVIDLQKVTFFGSAGLNAMLDSHEQGKAAGTAVRLVASHGQVLQPIEVTELDRILDIYPTFSDAMRGVKPFVDPDDGERGYAG
ncbi:anti-anti-sigma factor [Mycobacterium sp. 852002-51163_SCH5372311]|uniref:STAS domain-containing protein n=1 Tax=Mycobacterium sp. 852002-51163_SCH5372311 TaxID=1834097 RepID=UPI0007FD672E|nr:STAS domain-containing protein [Mycobacterium sp. 852002-51163_SCH5372311]OBF92895.1 anti-anti-sigma factor [Mycobacterium sp. 852002-51163_SCH5372311]